MLNKIIRFSLENRILVLVASVLLVIGGLYSTSKTDVDVFPDLNAPTVVIMTEAGGMATEEVEQLVTFPIETAVNGSTDATNTNILFSSENRMILFSISSYNQWLWLCAGMALEADANRTCTAPLVTTRSPFFTPASISTRSPSLSPSVTSCLR